MVFWRIAIGFASRDNATMLLQTLGMITALIFAVICTSTSILSVEDGTKCGQFARFFRSTAFAFQFGLALLVVLLVQMFAVGGVAQKEKAWTTFVPFLLGPTLVNIALFVIICIKMSEIMSSHVQCQRLLALTALAEAPNSTLKVPEEVITNSTALYHAYSD